MEIYVDDEAKLTLHGLVQHYVMLNEDQKNRKLNDLLDALDFNQVGGAAWWCGGVVVHDGVVGGVAAVGLAVVERVVVKRVVVGWVVVDRSAALTSACPRFLTPSRHKAFIRVKGTPLHRLIFHSPPPPASPPGRHLCEECGAGEGAQPAPERVQLPLHHHPLGHASGGAAAGVCCVVLLGCLLGWAGDRRMPPFSSVLCRASEQLSSSVLCKGSAWLLERCCRVHDCTAFLSRKGCCARNCTSPVPPTRTSHPYLPRSQVYKEFKEGAKRILVATDLVGRGIDIERVNIVINYDMPETGEAADS
jgi:hypothetical protein